MSDMSGLPKWRSHKTVQAAKIMRVEAERRPDGTRTLTLDGGQTWAAGLGHAIWSRYIPVEGDYLVVYEDGYTSISPKKAFEDGYTRIEG